MESSGWIVVDPWETITPEYVPTANVLDHFEHEINEVLGGVERPDGTRVPAKICLLAGADLISTMVRVSKFEAIIRLQGRLRLYSGEYLLASDYYLVMLERNNAN